MSSLASWKSRQKSSSTICLKSALPRRKPTRVRSTSLTPNSPGSTSRISPTKKRLPKPKSPPRSPPRRPGLHLQRPRRRNLLPLLLLRRHLRPRRSSMPQRRLQRRQHHRAPLPLHLHQFRRSSRPRRLFRRAQFRQPQLLRRQQLARRQLRLPGLPRPHHPRLPVRDRPHRRQQLLAQSGQRLRRPAYPGRPCNNGRQCNRAPADQLTSPHRLPPRAPLRRQDPSLGRCPSCRKSLRFRLLRAPIATPARAPPLRVVPGPLRPAARERPEDFRRVPAVAVQERPVEDRELHPSAKSPVAERP
jgi:hypothetical protein